MPVISRHIGTAALTSAFALALPAQAIAKPDLANVAMIADQTCDGIGLGGTQPGTTDLPFKGGKWRIVPNSRLAYFVGNFASEVTTPDKALAELQSLDTDPKAVEAHRAASDVLHHLEAKVASGNIAGLLAFDANDEPINSSRYPRDSSWLVRSEVTLRCLVPEANPSEPPPPALTSSEPHLRGNVAALTAAGSDLQSADAASFGYSRTRTYETDGSRSQATEISIDAVLGVVLDGGLPFNLTAYAGYELKQNRSRPAPTLVAPATQRDGDTDIVTLGLVGGSTIALGGRANPWTDSLKLSYSAAYLFDRVKDSERVKAQIQLRPYHAARLFGLCKIGGLTDLGGKIWTSCHVDGIVTYQKVTRHGALLPAGKDHFGHAGIKLAGALYLGDPSKGSSLFASADYQRLWRYDGDPAFIPEIRRYSFSIGHRWWPGKKIGFEIKAELTDGINPDSFADENSLTLGFGVVF